MKLIVKSLLFAGLLFLGLNVSAQTVQDAGNIFNKANQQFNNKAYGQAVKLYEQALTTCKAAGPDAMQLQMQVTTQLSKAEIYYGVELAKQKQFDQSIAQLLNSRKLAAASGDAKTKALATKYASLIYYFKGNSLYLQKNLAGADAAYNSALKLDPNNIRVYVSMSKEALEQKNYSKMEEMIDKIKVLQSKDMRGSQYYGAVRQMAFKAYLNLGAKELQNKQSTKALEYFAKAKKYYAASSILYYNIAVANANLKRWDAAISNGKKALSLERNSKDDIYFILGKAYQGKGMKTDACMEFKRVMHGPNVASAKYQIKHVLKCK